MEKIIRNREPWDMPTNAFLICVSLIIVAIVGQTWWSITQDKLLTLSSAQENSYLTVRILEEHASRMLHDASRATGAVSEEIQNESEKSGTMKLPCGRFLLMSARIHNFFYRFR